MGEENLPDMGEMGEDGFGFNEGHSDNRTGCIIDGKGEALVFLSGLPLMWRAVVLEKVAIALVLPSAAGFGAAFDRFVQQCAYVLEDIVADIGDEAFEGEPAVEFVSQEAEVGRSASGESGAHAGLSFVRPSSSVVASGGAYRKTAASGQPEGPQGVET